VKLQWVHYKLDETIESLVVISWPHNKGSMNMLGPHGKMEILVSWKQVMKSLLMGMCTTFVECKTLITVVLMVMSDMDPHMISRTWDGFVLDWICLSGFL
jgi:hypothetical protein